MSRSNSPPSTKPSTPTQLTNVATNPVEIIDEDRSALPPALAPTPATAPNPTLAPTPALAPAWKNPTPVRRRARGDITPADQEAEERETYVAWLNKEYGGFIRKELARRRDIVLESTKDLGQIVLLYAWEHHKEDVKAGKSGTPEKMEAFLRCVIENRTRNHIRKKARRPQIEDGTEVDERPGAAPDPEERAMYGEMREAAARCHAELTPREAEVVEAREVDGISFEVIGLGLGLSKTRAFEIHAEAMKKLRSGVRASGLAAALGGRGVSGKGLPGDRPAKPRRRKP